MAAQKFAPLIALETGAKEKMYKYAACSDTTLGSQLLTNKLKKE